MIISLGLGAITYGEIARLCTASMPYAIQEMRPSRLVTDSREIRSGDLFCALKGKEDGHKYIEEASRRGAAAVLAESETAAKLPHILVSSVRKALGDWAIGASERTRLIRIGITGSVGKTTTKDAIAAMLSQRYSVHATYGNFNNELGLPFTLLATPPKTEIAVCELGISHHGEMEELSRILRPHISVITCIGHAHIGAFGSREAIADEKLAILSHAKANGVLFVPHGEALLTRLLPHGIRRIATSPFDEACYKKHGLSPFRDDVAKNFALAYAASVGKELSLSEAAITSGLRDILSLETHRHEIRVADMIFIDDGYNASPESMLGAIRYLNTLKGRRRVAVLGDMLELGEDSARFHRAIGRFAAEHTDRLFFFGAYAKEYARGAKAAGAREDSETKNTACVFSVLDGEKEEIAMAIHAAIESGDTVLFKASRALQVEKIIEMIKKRVFI